MHEPSTLPVMVIDDEPHLRITASQTLELAGYTPHCFESAEQALAALPNDFPGVIVSDIRMPGMDGMALLHELHSRDATLPIILITGHGDISTAVEAMRAGAWDFLEKPFALESRARGAASRTGPALGWANASNLKACRDDSAHQPSGSRRAAVWRNGHRQRLGCQSDSRAQRPT